MQISSLTDIVEGTLLNTPAISFITQSHIDINNINEGDAFFTAQQSDINTAISKGVFAIIVDFEPEILDNEIAWIKVDNLDKAITNILRYKLLEYDIKYVQTNRIFFTFLELFKTKDMTDVFLLKDDFFDDFEKLNKTNSAKIIFGTNLNFMNDISGDVVSLKTIPYEIQNLTSHTLFETSFSYQDKFFSRLKIPTSYINELIQQLELFDYRVDLKRLNNFELFKPLFINKSNQIVSHGQTNRFILASIDLEICNIDIEYLYKYYSYANIKVVDTKELTEDDIFLIIKNMEFNALYFKGICIKQIATILKKKYSVDSLI